MEQKAEETNAYIWELMVQLAKLQRSLKLALGSPAPLPRPPMPLEGPPTFPQGPGCAPPPL